MWLFNYQVDPKSLYVYTDTGWAADEQTRKSVSCTVERYASHMIDCSVAKQSCAVLRRGRVLRHCQGLGDVKANLTGLGNRSECGGDHCIRQQCSTRNPHENGIGKRTMRHLSIKELWIQEAYRKKEFQLVSVDTLPNWADIGTKAHTSERMTSLLMQKPLRLKEGQTKALTCLTLMNEEHRASHGGDGEGRDG